MGSFGGTKAPVPDLAVVLPPHAEARRTTAVARAAPDILGNRMVIGALRIWGGGFSGACRPDGSVAHADGVLALPGQDDVGAAVPRHVVRALLEVLPDRGEPAAGLQVDDEAGVAAGVDD